MRGRTKLLVTGCVLVGCATAVVVSPAGGAIFDTVAPPKLDLPDASVETAPPVSAPSPESVGSPESGETAASEAAAKSIAAAKAAAQLPPELRARAERIISADQTVDRLLAGTEYKVARLGPWTHGGSAEIIGAIADLRLSSPVDARDVVLPGVHYNRAETAYERMDIHVSFSDARALFVQVDFARDEVVSVRPGLDAIVTEEPGNRHLPSPGAAAEPARPH